jgi:hypothetical protein
MIASLPSPGSLSDHAKRHPHPGDRIDFKFLMGSFWKLSPWWFHFWHHNTAGADGPVDYSLFAREYWLADSICIEQGLNTARPLPLRAGAGSHFGAADVGASNSV